VTTVGALMEEIVDDAVGELCQETGLAPSTQ
jgi:hypothetical protein